MATVVSAYGSPGSDEIAYSLSDQSKIAIALTQSDSSFAGYAPVGNNPGDLEYGTGKAYYDDVVGSYQGRIELASVGWVSEALPIASVLPIASNFRHSPHVQMHIGPNIDQK